MTTLWRAGAIACGLGLASVAPVLAVPGLEAHAFRLRPGQDLLEGLVAEARLHDPVSYTHLTLPTIYSV